MKQVTFKFIERKYDYTDLVTYIGHFVKINANIKVSAYYTFYKEPKDTFIDIKCYIYGKNKDLSFVILPFEYCCWTIYILKKDKLIKEWEVQKEEITDFLTNIKIDFYNFKNHYIKVFSICHKHERVWKGGALFGLDKCGIYHWIKKIL